MKTIVTFILSWFAFHFFSAQQVSFNQINSTNVIEYYSRMQLQPQTVDLAKITETQQIGNGNTIEVYDRTPNYMVLSQIGNYNTTYFINPNQYPTNAEININGSGNYIDIAGSNSISEGMKININANDMTIFMRNY